MHVVARTRLVVATRPWIYWAVVSVLVAATAFVVHAQMASLDAARHALRETRPVLVAAAPLEPGDRISARTVDLPIALVPVGALDAVGADALARQRVATGEVLNEFDVSDRPGPAALADDGTVVVGLSDPLSRGVAVGLTVQVTADGLVLAETASIVDVDGDVTFVAVDPSDGPAVAAAAQQGIASLLFVP